MRIYLRTDISIMVLRILLLLGGSVTTPQILPRLGEFDTTPRILLHLGGFNMTPQILPHLEEFDTTPRILPHLGEFDMTPRIFPHLGEFDMTPRILLHLGGLVMIHRIPLLSGSIVFQLHLLGELVMTHQTHLLLGGPITVPQISLRIEESVIAPLTHLNLEGLLTPWTHRVSGGPVMTPLIHCPEPKAVKAQKDPLTKLLHIGRDQDLLIPRSRRIASMSMTQISLLHEESKQNSIPEINSMILKALHLAIGNIIQALHLEDIRVTRWTLLPTQVTVRKPLIQIFLLHGISGVQGTRILLLICHLHGTDLDTRALILTSLHQGGNRGPDLLIPTCLHLEGLSLWGRRLHTCILGLKLGWC